MLRIMLLLSCFLFVAGCSNRVKSDSDDNGKPVLVVSDNGSCCSIRAVEIDGAKYILVSGMNKCAICPAVDAGSKK